MAKCLKCGAFIYRSAPPVKVARRSRQTKVVRKCDICFDTGRVFDFRRLDDGALCSCGQPTQPHNRSSQIDKPSPSINFSASLI